MSLLDECAARFDFVVREHHAATVSPSQVWAALPGLLADPPRLFGGAAVPNRQRAGIAGFDELLSTARWVLLRRDANEVVLGAAGRFWTPFMDWQQLSAEEFTTFSRPRRATIAVSLAVLSYGRGQQLLTFEARVRSTDAIAFRWADWYWQSIRASARLVVRDLLRDVHRAAETVPHHEGV
ncbi:hypothetical protein LWP59_18610 [Amycolatopsis acidiphila]|nr:hypothetical protein [Amycolatopsis acidiphila]UIJ63492.1 hypothetical protein LWP59_18610 [Amycolatopsis acidiphila]GHG68615.1 hypothetical protein GCM10017788_28480 [Amycolatopsis acidiphila]